MMFWMMTSVAAPSGDQKADPWDDGPCVTSEANAHGNGPPQDGWHGSHQLEYQSTAGVEGWADFVSAWAWNSRTQSDCVYDHDWTHDYDLDGDIDNDFVGAQYSCEGASWDLNSNGIVDGGEKTVAGFVDARDWLEDVVVNTTTCSASTALQNRGTHADWTRFWWDMTTDEGFTPTQLANLYDAMNPRNWNASGNGSGGGYPVGRLTSACTTLSMTTACNNQRTNGQDH